MQLESKTHTSPLLTAMVSPVAQWLEHPTRSQRIVGSNPIWGSDFSEIPMGSIVTISFTVLKVAVDNVILGLCDSCDYFASPLLM